jgi:hypothetical protein
MQLDVGEARRAQPLQLRLGAVRLVVRVIAQQLVLDLLVAAPAAVRAIARAAISSSNRPCSGPSTTTTSMFTNMPPGASSP